jgi:hypothetical protein
MSGLPRSAVVAGGLAVGAYLNARLGNDLSMASGLINSRIGLASANRKDENSIYYYFDRAHKQRGDADCYVCDGYTMSFNQVAKGLNYTPSFLSLLIRTFTDLYDGSQR